MQTTIVELWSRYPRDLPLCPHRGDHSQSKGNQHSLTAATCFSAHTMEELLERNAFRKGTFTTDSTTPKATGKKDLNKSTKP